MGMGMGLETAVRIALAIQGHLTRKKEKNKLI
jgi:hypothetical protein